MINVIDMNVTAFRAQLLAITDAYPKEEGNAWIFEMYLPPLKQGSIKETGDLLSDLYNNLDLHHLNIMAISFYKDITEDLAYYYIGAIDTDKIVIDKERNEVLLLSEEDDLLYCLAKDLSNYLEVLVLLSAYSIQGYFGHTFIDSDRKAVLTRCKLVLEKEKYFPYYEVSFS